jgi:hypothetical protein
MEHLASEYDEIIAALSESKRAGLRSLLLWLLNYYRQLEGRTDQLARQTLRAGFLAACAV